MYLAVMLIIVAVLVFYNEYNKNMNIAEIGLLVVALIAIVRASMNYINLSDTASFEGFTDTTRKRSNKSRGKNKVEDVIVLESSKSKEYFNTDEEENNTLLANAPALGNTLLANAPALGNTTPQTTQHTMTSLSRNKIDENAVSELNKLLGITGSSQSNFDDIPPSTTKASTTRKSKINASRNEDGSIESVYVPQIQIGKGARDSLAGGLNMQGMNMTNLSGLGVPNVASLASTASALGVGDNMSFPNTMKPSSNLWSSDLDYMDTSKNWSQSMVDYNKGKWNPNTYAKASDYIDYYTPSAYGMNTPPNTNDIGIGAVSSSNSSKSQFDNVSTSTTTPQPTTLDSNGQPKKLCGAYDDLNLDQAGNLVVQNYTQAKKWIPGYTYVPPVYWDVPQKHVGTCQAANPNARKLTGLVDRGLPINALELNPDGSMANTEDTVSLTNVGSILPKFNYEETPFSKPYI